MNESWAPLWESVADAMRGGVALVQGARRLPWSEVDDRAARAAAAFAALGLGRDGKAAFLAYNSPEHLEGVFAAFKLRASPINLNFRYLEDELVEVLDDAGAELLVFDGSLAGRVDAVRDRLPALRAV